MNSLKSYRSEIVGRVWHMIMATLTPQQRALIRNIQGNPHLELRIRDLVQVLRKADATLGLGGNPESFEVKINEKLPTLR